MITLSPVQARRAAVSAALLGRDRPEGIADAVRRLGGVRVETTAHVATSAEHILHTRLGPDLGGTDVGRVLASGEVFERDGILHPTDELPLFLAGAASWPDRAGTRGWMEANADFADAVMARVRDEGPLTSRQVPDEAVAPWTSAGWNHDRSAARMLDCLHMTGELAVTGHVGRLRVFDLADRVYPPSGALPSESDARRTRNERSFAALGIARQGRTHSFDTAEFGEPVEISGIPGRWRVDPAVLESEWEPRGAAVLSPFDRLLADPHRTAHVFDFDYTLEMYKPKAARRWGYFALPVLIADRLAGKVDAATDRDRGELRVDRLIEDDGWTRAERALVTDELESLARFLSVDLRIA